jgi:hypothetical protein
MAAMLPPAFDDVDVSTWESLSPEDLMLRPTLVSEQDGGLASARALKYSRSGRADAYDEIGFRLSAATPYRGAAPLATIPSMRLQRRWNEATQYDPVIEAVLADQRKLLHRPIEAPTDGRFRYTIGGGLLQVMRPRADAQVSGDEEVWTFPLTTPPKMIQALAEPRDEPLVAAQQYQIDVPGAFWLPLPLLIETGRVRPMQEWRDRLPSRTLPRHFYCFVSHRWLTPTHPDPQGVQTAFLAWQMVGHLCEAIRVATMRGLHEPRQFAAPLGVEVGVTGSSLAEALIVNVLRQVLDDAGLAAAWEEVGPLRGITADYGVAAARNDTGLERLRGIVNGRSVLSTLIERIVLWYDYGCMPQAPRTAKDERLFRDGLRHLNVMQALGRTAILLDEAEDYLSRGWCSLEALVADTELGNVDLLIGSARGTAAGGVTEHYFDMLMQDRPHLVWRAILDTELFRIQTPDQCLARLNLAVTEARDIPFIYDGLRMLRMPVKLHVDDSEIVTGAFPVPLIGETTIVVPTSSEYSVSRADDDPGTWQSLDWTDVLRLRTGWDADADATAIASMMGRDGGRPDVRSCHVAIVASCEGEAVLFTTWLSGRLDQLEGLIDARVDTLSWLAADIAPVGHLIDGTLRVVPVEADVWVLVSSAIRFTHSGLTSAIQSTLVATSTPYFTLAIDESHDNLHAITPPRLTEGDPETERLLRQCAAVELDDLERPIYVGGLYREILIEYLAR